MSLWWLIDLVFIILTGITSILVVASWTTGLSKWEKQIINIKENPSSYKDWQKIALQNAHIIVGICIFIMIVAFVQSAQAEKIARQAEIAANDKAIAAANALALSDAGVIDMMGMAKVDQLGPQEQESKENRKKEGIAIATDGKALKAIEDVSSKVLEAKKAQEKAVDLMLENNEASRRLNLIITGVLLIIVSASVASFFAGKSSGGGAKSWLIYFMVFLSMGSASTYQVGGVKIFNENQVSKIK